MSGDQLDALLFFAGWLCYMFAWLSLLARYPPMGHLGTPSIDAWPTVLLYQGLLLVTVGCAFLAWLQLKAIIDFGLLMSISLLIYGVTVRLIERRLSRRAKRRHSSPPDAL
ncbi:MAG TPA: hypothetical protein VF807_07000 [Ktedonobacterales bacterium]